MKLSLRGWLSVVAKVAHPLLRLVGIKKGTVADKAADAAVVIDEALPKEEPKR